eukprot:3734331-Pyramimonas_sp.AAC.1
MEQGKQPRARNAAAGLIYRRNEARRQSDSALEKQLNGRTKASIQMDRPFWLGGLLLGNGG